MVLFFYYSVPNHYSSTDILSFLNIQATFCSLLHTHNSPPNLHPPTTQQRPNAPLRLSSVFTTTYIPRPTSYKKLQSYHPPPTLHIMHPTTHTKHSLSHTPHPASHTFQPTLHFPDPFPTSTSYYPLLFPAPYLQVNFCTPPHR